PVTHLVNFSNCFSNHSTNRPIGLVAETRSSFPKREVSKGTMVNETSKLSMVEIITTTQNSRKMSETNPVLTAIGRNTTTITEVMDTTVKPISLVASTEALTLFFPISM